jgi:hypothetical protein
MACVFRVVGLISATLAPAVDMVGIASNETAAAAIGRIHWLCCVTVL